MCLNCGFYRSLRHMLSSLFAVRSVCCHGYGVHKPTCQQFAMLGQRYLPSKKVHISGQKETHTLFNIMKDRFLDICKYHNSDLLVKVVEEMREAVFAQSDKSVTGGKLKKSDDAQRQNGTSDRCFSFLCFDVINIM